MKKIFSLTLFLSIALSNLFSQKVNEWSNEMVLWQCQSDPNLKLMYRVNLGEGGYNSLVELIVPSNMGTSTISGVLKVEENKKPESYNSSSVKTETIKIDQASIDKQYNFNISNISQISFEGTCNVSNSTIKVNFDKAEKYEFPPSKSELTDIQTKKIFDLFFGKNASKDLTIDNEDKKQAEILLKELINKSCEMAIVESISSLDPTLISVVNAIYQSNKNCKAIKNGVYYETIRKTIAFNFSQNFQIRKQTGEW